jgi:hypothetical protein
MGVELLGEVLALDVELSWSWSWGGWCETGMKDCVCSDNFFYEELRLGGMCDLSSVVLC